MHHNAGENDDVSLGSNDDFPNLSLKHQSNINGQQTPNQNQRQSHGRSPGMRPKLGVGSASRQVIAVSAKSGEGLGLHRAPRTPSSMNQPTPRSNSAPPSLRRIYSNNAKK